MLISWTPASYPGIYVICRRERGNCKICWYASDNDFNISGIADNNGVINTCCGYGEDGKKANKDCVVIPSASTPAGVLIANKGFCGNRLVTAAGSTSASVCCKYCRGGICSKFFRLDSKIYDSIDIKKNQ